LPVFLPTAKSNKNKAWTFGAKHSYRREKSVPVFWKTRVTIGCG